MDQTQRSRIASLALVALTIGCGDVVAPRQLTPEGTSLLKEVDGRPSVYNFQLRAIDDPNIRPSAAHGHLQLKATLLGDGSVRIAYKGQIFNPAGERFTGFSLGSTRLGRSSILIALGNVGGVSDRRIDPEDATIVSAEVAARLYGTPDTIDDPNLLVVTFFTTRQPGGALRGEYALPAVQSGR